MWNFWTLNFFWKILTPYRWYIDPPIHGILIPLSMVYWPPYPWYIDPPTHGILTPLPMGYRTPYPWYFDPLSLVYWTPYPWYIDPPIHGILTHLPIEYRPPYTWYFDLFAYLLIRNGGVQNTMGVQFTIQVGSIFNKGVQYTMDVNRPQVQFTMGFKKPYHTVTSGFWGEDGHKTTNTNWFGQ